MLYYRFWAISEYEFYHIWITRCVVIRVERVTDHCYIFGAYHNATRFRVLERVDKEVST